MKKTLLQSLLSIACLSSTMAFAPSPISTPTRAQSTSLNFSPATTNLISTISADIDNIPQNEFATVFAGGIAVMIGGVLSTVIVGFLLESGNSYANVVADSYAQGGDEEFWNQLNPEEREKAESMLKKLRESKGENVDLPIPPPPSTSESKTEEKKEEKAKVASNDMFSDYDD